MKKILFALALSLGAATAAQAQVEIGLKITPSLGFQRANGSVTIPFPVGNDLSNTVKSEISPDGARVHFGGGLVIDYFFGENYAFNTGIELVGKGGIVKLTTTPGGAVQSAKFGLQYLQVPLAIKLFTNEVAPDTRVYFLVGGQLGALVGANIDGKKTVPVPGSTDDRKASKNFNTFDAGAQVGAGAELQLGKSTKAFGGLSYQHGLLNIIDKSYGGFNSTAFTVKNSGVNLDLGLKF